MYDNWLTAMENSRVVGALLIDFSAAFDLVDHDLLMKKLDYYSFKASTVMWVSSYLFNRTQNLLMALSQSRQLECGLPQGSCLGPLFCSIFTNDLPLVFNKCDLTMYANDCTM